MPDIEEDKPQDQETSVETEQDGEPDTDPGTDLFGEPLAGEADPDSPVPSGIDWSARGPRIWVALHHLLSGNKTKHDDKYVIEASHEAVGEAHAVLEQ